jgi:hypothetical protein
MSIPDAGRYYYGIGRNASYAGARLGLFALVPVGKKKKKVSTRAQNRLMEEAGNQPIHRKQT